MCTQACPGTAANTAAISCQLRLDQGASTETKKAEAVASSGGCEIDHLVILLHKLLDQRLLAMLQPARPLSRPLDHPQNHQQIQEGCNCLCLGCLDNVEDCHAC